MNDLPRIIRADEDCNRVASFWIKLGRQIAAIEEEKEVLAARSVIAKATVRKKDLQDQLGASEALFEPLLGRYAKRKLKGTGKRTYHAGLMDIGLVECTQTLVGVVDEEAALAFVGQHCPGAIERKPKIKLSKFTDDFRKYVGGLAKATLRKAGLSVILPHDNVHITLKTQAPNP